MASGSQLNRWGQNGGVPLLYCDTSSSAVATPLTGYGTIPKVADFTQQGQNPPNFTMWRGTDSGPYVTPIGMTKVMFQLLQVGGTAPTTFGFTVYGTTDPNAYLSYIYDGTTDPVSTSFTSVFPTTQGTAYAIPASSWSPIPAPSVEGGSPDIAAFGNPITPTNPLYFCAYPFVGYRVVLTAAGGAGACVVVAFGVP